jgi:hypothetical protein
MTGEFKQGQKRGNAGRGRPKGSPNKVTADARTFFAAFAERNLPKLDGLIDRAARKSPAKAADLILRAAEYHVPKLARMEHTGKDGEPVKVVTLPAGAERL